MTQWLQGAGWRGRARELAYWQVDATDIPQAPPNDQASEIKITLLPPTGERTVTLADALSHVAPSYRQRAVTQVAARLTVVAQSK